MALALLLALATHAVAQQPAEHKPAEQKPAVRPPVDSGGTATAAAELRSLLARIRQERKAAQVTAEAWQREKAEFEDERTAVQEDCRRLQAELDRLREHAVKLEARTAAADNEAENAATRERALRSLLVRSFAWIHALNESSLPAGRATRRERIVTAWREAVRAETPIASSASTLFGLAFRWLGDSRSFEVTDTVIADDAAGRRRAVEVLRIGLVGALALTPDDTTVHATVVGPQGRPVWGPPETRPGLIERARDGLEIIGRRRTPEVIVLPLPGWPTSMPAPPLPDAAMPQPPKAPPPPAAGKVNENATGKESRP